MVDPKEFVEGLNLSFAKAQDLADVLGQMISPGFIAAHGTGTVVAESLNRVMALVSALHDEAEFVGTCVTEVADLMHFDRETREKSTCNAAPPEHHGVPCKRIKDHFGLHATLDFDGGYVDERWE